MPWYLQTRKDNSIHIQQISPDDQNQNQNQIHILNQNQDHNQVCIQHSGELFALEKLQSWRRGCSASGQTWLWSSWVAVGAHSQYIVNTPLIHNINLLTMHKLHQLTSRSNGGANKTYTWFLVDSVDRDVVCVDKYRNDGLCSTVGGQAESGCPFQVTTHYQSGRKRGICIARPTVRLPVI